MAATFAKSSMRDTVESLVVTAILAVFGTTFVLQAFKIPTGSMETTLLIGDHLLVNKFVYGGARGFRLWGLPYRDVRRDDVVVFRYPYDPDEYFVKRVIGLPGDRVRIENRVLYVNGVRREEPFVHHTFLEQVRSGDNYPPASPEMLRGAAPEWSADLMNHVEKGELVVPPGNLFVMGDNREQSFDSRFWGFMPQENLAGRPLIIYWSFESSREEYRQTSLGARLKQTVNLLIHFFTKTRWRRTLRLVR